MKRLYVSNVSSKSDENELRELFEECGKMKFFGIKEGAGYIEYETPEEANECLKKYERFELHGKTMTVENARKFKPKPPFRSSGSRKFKRDYRRSSSNSRSESKSSSSKSRSHRKKKSKKRERSKSASGSRSDSRSRSRSRNHKKHRK